jgi:hypothetical protein
MANSALARFAVSAAAAVVVITIRVVLETAPPTSGPAIVA